MRAMGGTRRVRDREDKREGLGGGSVHLDHLGKDLISSVMDGLGDRYSALFLFLY